MRYLLLGLSAALLAAGSWSVTAGEVTPQAAPPAAPPAARSKRGPQR